jgi:hypothetical protein
MTYTLAVAPREDGPGPAHASAGARVHWVTAEQVQEIVLRQLASLAPGVQTTITIRRAKLLPSRG